MRKTILFLAILLLCSLTGLFFFLRQAVFISDPYWDMSVGIPSWQQRIFALTSGRWLKIVKVESWSNAQQVAEQAGEQLVVFSPYWRNELEREKLNNFKLLSGEAVPELAAQQQVVFKQEELFRAAAQLLKRQLGADQRQQVYAYFYAGNSYDDYVVAFSSVFAGDESQLVLKRYFNSQINTLEEELEELNLASLILFFAVPELNQLVLEKLSSEEELLFVSEDVRQSAYLEDKMLFSLEKDYLGALSRALKRGQEHQGYLYRPSASPLLVKTHPLLKKDSMILGYLKLLWN